MIDATEICRRKTALARAAVTFDQAVSALYAIGDHLVGIDEYDIVPAHRHAIRSIFRLDELLFDLENYGCSFPDGAPSYPPPGIRLRLASDDAPAGFCDELKRQAA